MEKQKNPFETVPSWFYRTGNSELWELERKHIFLDSWIFVGLASEIKKPGQYFLWKGLNKSVIVSRGVDGNVYAMSNTCRHRGFPLLSEERGKLTEDICCAYHQWHYNKKGELTETPLSTTCHKNICLPQYKVSLVYKNLIFINFSNKTTDPLPQTYFPKKLSELFKLKDAITLSKPRSDSYPVKWPLIMDNFQEGHHAQFNHPIYRSLFEGGIVSDHLYRFRSAEKSSEIPIVQKYMELAKDFPKVFPELPIELLDGWH